MQGSLTEIRVSVTTPADCRYALTASELIAQAAKEAEIALRQPEFLEKKIRAGQAVIALLPSGELVGFGFFSAWADGAVSHSGLVVAREYRGVGLGKQLKVMLMEASRRCNPESRTISLTTSPEVRTMNLQLGFRVVNDLAELTSDPKFWDGCKGCHKYNEINETRTGAPTPCGTYCCCQGMVLDPK